MMSAANRIRLSGVIGMASAGVWLIALVIEYGYGLQPPGNGSLLYYANQIMFFLALVGYLLLLLGLWNAKAAGDRLFGRIALGIFMGGLAVLLVAQIVSWLTKSPDVFLYPVGGILQLFGGLLTGIAVITARHWHGWQKFAPLLQGLYYMLLLILLAVFDQEPTQLTESIWQVTWFITSLALFTMTGPAAPTEG